MQAAAPACEKNPELFKLLENGKSRIKSSSEVLELLTKIEWINQDSYDFMSNDCERKWDVVYMDPMYPEKSKSALPKKEMQVLQQLVGEADDEVELLRRAMSVSRNRVVVKRAPKAPAIIPHPSQVFEGKSVRFDMYLN